jgi:hypothetical protein
MGLKTHYPYSKYSITPIKGIARNDFNIPFDKIYLRTAGSILPLRHEELMAYVASGKRYFQRLNSFRYYYKGIYFSFYYSNSETEIQLNPTNFFSYTGMLEVTKAIMEDGFKFHRITKLHVFADYPICMEDAIRSLYVKGPRLSRTFAFEIIRRFGDIEQLKLNRTFGSLNTRVDTIYDSNKKHGLPSPSIRLESRLNNTKAVGFKKLHELEKIIERNLFSRFEFRRPYSIDTSTVDDKTKYVVMLIEKLGQHEAIKMLKKNAKQHFKKKYGPCLELLLESIDLEPNELLNNRIRAFIKADVHPIEQELVKIIQESKRGISPK